ncbi:hypothetical protein ACIBG7_26595 [Nonomuraea sp. NPDC050328]|uniref:hypothetical protein n=1 Tax=Nonomuraea sp. NPDC050328 TaxID=3364361 RepID=UPI0037B17ADA
MTGHDSTSSPSEHATRRIRILGASAHPTGQWVTQVGRNLLTDLNEAGICARFLIRERDAKSTDAFDAVLTDPAIQVVTTGIRIPRMNSIMERWIQTCRRELLDRRRKSTPDRKEESA